jgi:Fuc2NAc and GlcNAc transferase
MLSMLPGSRLAWLVAAVAFAGAWLMTMAVRRYAIRSGLLDRPNERSSHAVPTPRGGGVAIVLAFLAGTVVMAYLDLVSVRLATAVIGAGALVAFIGFSDDRKPLSARVRFGAHLLAAAWVAAHLGVLPRLPVAGTEISLGLLGPPLAVVLIAWSINLFNFMDGIDGIAGIEAVTVCLGGGLLWAVVGASGQSWLAFLLAGSAAGFLLWNFPPARIFMGDAGSGFLGLLIAVMALWSGSEQPVLFWSWMILYGCFFVDASVTLVRRVRRGDKFYEAHRSHAYQYASRRLGGHRPVSLAVGAINLVWLLPVAALVATGHLDGLVGLVIAWTPLVVLAFRFKAGDRKGQET